MNKIGHIYKITNNITGMMYVGKTFKTLKERWKVHKSDSTRDRNNTRPLYRALREYGVDNFSIELLENVPEESLCEREIFWINELKTCDSGYNVSLGGEGKHLYNYEKIAEMLRVGSLSYSEIAERVGCCIDTVSFVRKLYGIEHIPTNNFEKTGITVEQYTLDGEYVQSFKSFREAGRWLIANGYAKQSYDGGVSQHIGSVCMGKRKSAYGFLWKKLI